MPRVSVNICTWSPHPVFFRESVLSILHQTFEDFEVILVEDPSEVDGRTFIADLLSDERIRYFRNTDRTGLLNQKNQALALSSGDFIAILDHDDISHPTRLEQQVNFLAQNPEISVVGTWIRAIDEHGNAIGVRKYPVNPDEICRALRRFSPLAHPSVMFRKHTIQELGGYTWFHPVDPLGLVSDYDLWCRLAKAGFKMANIPQVLLDYRLHSGAQKAATTRVFLKATLIIKRRYFSREFTLRDWIRFWFECALLLFPPAFTWHLFKRITYRPIR